MNPPPKLQITSWHDINSTVGKRYTDSTNHRGITVIIEAVCNPQYNMKGMFYDYTRPELEPLAS